MSKIVVVGSYLVDLMTRTPHLPRPGETVLGGPFKMGPGGKGSNQATAAARSGSNVTLVTKLGDDLFGQEAIKHFKKEKINLEHIKIDTNEETGTALIAVNEESENIIVVALGACGTLAANDVQAAEDEVKEADIVLLQLETSVEAVEETVALATKHNIPVILNPAPYQEFPKEILKDVNYITPNEIEAFELSGVVVQDELSAKKAAKKIYGMGVENIIITMGKHGVYLYTGEGTGELVPAFTVEAIDTTGAGDAFNGGFAHALSIGYSLKEAIRFSNAVAALSVTRAGTAPAMPYKNEVEAFLEQQK